MIGTVSSVCSLFLILTTLAYHENILDNLDGKVREKRCAYYYSSFATLEKPLPHNTTSKIIPQVSRDTA